MSHEIRNKLHAKVTYAGITVPQKAAGTGSNWRLRNGAKEGNFGSVNGR